MIERMLASFFGVDQRPTKAEPKPVQVVDLQDIPGLEKGELIPWMSAEEYLRRRAERHGNG